MGGLLAILDDDRRPLKLSDRVAGDNHVSLRCIHRRPVAIERIVGDGDCRTFPHQDSVSLTLCCPGINEILTRILDRY